jgi:hypothetical protein
MTVWKVSEPGVPDLYFIGACCAVAHYQADRDRRSTPQDLTTPDGVQLIDCPKGAHP